MIACIFMIMVAFSVANTQVADQYTEVHMVNSDSQLNPENLKLTFDVEGQQVNLHLQQNPNVPNNIPIILGREGQLSEWQDSNTDFAAYTDTKNNASFLLQHRKVGQSPEYESTLSGTFRSQDTDYVVEPAPRAERHRRSASNSTIYKISLAPKYSTNINTEYRDSNINTSYYVNKWIEYDDSILAEDPVKQNYEIETMLFIDYAIYNRFFKVSTETSTSLREQDAISNIRYYFAHIVNGISLRYQSINYFDYSLSVRLVGMFIAMTEGDSYWTSKFGTLDRGFPKDFTEAYNALDDFEAWINLPHPELPPFDQATLFTGNQLFSRNKDGSRYQITGLADIASVCGEKRASVCQDNGIYAATQTAAHEMGHNVGAYHDGQGNSCSFVDQYVMASSPTELTESNYKNAFTFSYCSTNYFREYILLLNLNKKNCMLERGPSKFPQGEFDSDLLVLPGEKYTLDQQCQQVFGKESFYCGGHNKDTEMCRRIYCYNPGTRQCFSRTEQRAAAGTSCATRKWCQDGNCIFNERAPQIAQEFCRTGDFKGSFFDGRTCSETIKQMPWLCYDNSTYGGDCCRSCANIADNTAPECKYGDRSAYCDKILPQDCYTEDTRKTCCKKCAAAHTGILGCEYGDRASWCSSRPLASCYSEGSTCCLTCFQKRNKDKPQCPYGNMVSWCATQERHQCYEKNIQSQCCETCEKYYTAIQGCEYGDRSRFCSLEDCKSDKKRDCCATCRNSVNNTPAVTAAPPSSPDCKNTAGWCSTLLSSGCYNSENVCCETCGKYRSGPPGCEYGDKATWCSDYVKSPASCKAESVRTTCCKSCNTDIPTTTTTATTTTSVGSTDCPKGDQASWCASLAGSACYDPQTEKTCCHTCSTKKTGMSGCPYGDMFTWCKPVHCSQNKKDCCATCR